MPEISEQDFQNLKDQVQALANQLNAARNRIDELEDFAADHIGPDWGATGPGYPHPTAISLHREVHGPSKSSIDSTHSVTFPVDFDEVVSYLHQSKLSVRLSAVRSNVSTSASGGSSTLTSDSGGSSTPTSAAGGSHRHRVMAYASYNEIMTTGLPETGTFSTHYHILDAASGTWQGLYMKDVDSNNVTFTLPIPTGKDLYTFDTEAAHTHGVTIAAHTHGVTIAAHNHALTYGIYEGSAPSAPQITVTINGTDVTSALGGPWDDDFTVDITGYLRDHNGEPLRQTNTILLTSDELIDTEVVVKSFASAVQPASIGVAS